MVSKNFYLDFSLMLERLPTTEIAFIDPKYLKPQIIIWILFLKRVIM
jgi:hypothetical protein